MFDTTVLLIALGLQSWSMLSPGLVSASNITDDSDGQEFIEFINESFFSWIFDTVLPKLLFGLYILILVVGISTNALLVGVAISSKVYKHSVHAFLLQFSILDILACLSVVLPTLVNVAQGQTSYSRGLWEDENDSGDGLCKFHAFMFIWCFLLTFVLYDIMIVERATHAMSSGQEIHLRTFGNPCFLRLLAIGVWIVTLLVALIFTLYNGDKVRHRDDKYHCALDFPDSPGVMHALFSLTMYSSAVIFTVLLCVIFCIRHKKLRSFVNTDTSESKVQGEYGGLCELKSNLSKNTEQISAQAKAYAYMRNSGSFSFKGNGANPQNSIQKYRFSQHTETTLTNTTSVFSLELVSPHNSLRPIMRPLHRSNARVGAAPSIENHTKELTTMPFHFDGRKTSAKIIVPFTKIEPTEKSVKNKAQKVALPEFRSKRLWVKAKGVLSVRDTPLSVFRDVPHDVHHHQIMTYFIGWAVTYLLWVVYVIAAFTEVYDSDTCNACYRIGVLLGLSCYSIRPLVLVSHNRWYRQQCGQEMKRARTCLRQGCVCCCHPN